MIAEELARFLKVDEPVPTTFPGIPVLNNQQTWFFRYAYKIKEGDIDKLWQVFSAALQFADQQTDDNRSRFITTYDEALKVWGTKWNLTMGLYWIRPYSYLTLDTKSRQFLRNYNFKFGDKPPVGEEYVQQIEQLKSTFTESTFPAHSFPELSLVAWEYNPADEAGAAPTVADEPPEIPMPPEEKARDNAYSVQSIVDEGCFIEPRQLEEYIARLEQKKNLILQGPPGTGKTWLGKRLAYALMGCKDPDKVRAVQFHPNLSYEDFIRGYRPDGQGGLALCDGTFMEMVKHAQNHPEQKYFLVIEEINRGNPAQVFGEMLTLLESDKRSEEHALMLSYRETETEQVHIPENLYLIGTMNIADRSLAIIDFAFRRRFAFVNLQPQIGQRWIDWLHERNGIDRKFLNSIQDKLARLNDAIRDDNSLGEAFLIGHSYVTPTSDEPITNPQEWFRQIVETEIGPQLEEYWFDNPEKAREQRDMLLR